MRAVFSGLEALIVRVRSATLSGQLGRREVVADLAQTIRTPASFSAAHAPMLLLCDVLRNVYKLSKAFSSVEQV